MGYSLVDTANAYVNERAVGRGIKESSTKREDIFLSTFISQQVIGLLDIGSLKRPIEWEKPRQLEFLILRESILLNWNKNGK